VDNKKGIRMKFSGLAYRLLLKAALLAAVTGCFIGSGAYSRAITRLEPGMDRDQALRLVPVSGKKEVVPGLLGVEIFRFRVCDRMEGCRFERLIFIDEKYAGPELSLEALLTGQQLQPGMSPIELARAGVVPQLVSAAADGADKKIWGVRFRDHIHQEYAMFVFFSDGRVENWFVTPVHTLPPELFEQRKVVTMVELLLMIGTAAQSGSSAASGPGCGFCGFGMAHPP
jgi:hypothetical protein